MGKDADTDPKPPAAGNAPADTPPAGTPPATPPAGNAPAGAPPAAGDPPPKDAVQEILDKAAAAAPKDEVWEVPGPDGKKQLVSAQDAVRFYGEFAGLTEEQRKQVVLIAKATGGDPQAVNELTATLSGTPAAEGGTDAGAAVAPSAEVADLRKTVADLTARVGRVEPLHDNLVQARREHGIAVQLQARRKEFPFAATDPQGAQKVFAVVENIVEQLKQANVNIPSLGTDGLKKIMDQAMKQTDEGIGTMAKLFGGKAPEFTDAGGQDKPPAGLPDDQPKSNEPQGGVIRRAGITRAADGRWYNTQGQQVTIDETGRATVVVAPQVDTTLPPADVSPRGAPPASPPAGGSYNRDALRAKLRNQVQTQEGQQ